MLKMNSACIIQCAAIDPHPFNDGGRIGGNEFRERLDEVPSLRRPWSSAAPPSAAKHSPTPATTITTSIHLSTSCTRHPAGKSTRSALWNVVTAALAFRSITPRGLLVPRRRGALGLTPPLMDGARSSLHGCPKPAPPPAGASGLSLRLNAFGYNPTHLVQLTSTTSP